MKWQSSQFAVEEPKLKTRYFFCPLFDDFKLILVDSFGAYSHFYYIKITLSSLSFSYGSFNTYTS